MADTVQFTIHVPRNLNDNRRVPASFFRVFEARLVEIAGGFNRARTVGAYAMSDGSVKREPVYVYTSTVWGATRATRGAFSALAEYLKRALAQESVYLASTIIDGELV